MAQQPQDEAPCLICGATSYSWGRVQDDGNIKFKGEAVGFWERTTNLGGEPIRARKCELCGNVQLFVRF